MSDPDINISNGTCYYETGQQSADRFIPCGNSAFGHIHCCQEGDMCLENHACYNDAHGTTYLAGCTDFFYQDSSCPDKKSLAATDAESTSAPTSSSSLTSAFDTTVSPSLSTATSTPTDAPSSSVHTLSTAAKVGIGIVSAFGAMVLLGALSAMWMLMRRRSARKNSPGQDENCENTPAGADRGGNGGGEAKGSAPIMGPLAGQVGPAEMPTPGSPVRPAEMPTPNVPPRPTESGLGMGPWTVMPEPAQGVYSPPGMYVPYSRGAEKDWESQAQPQTPAQGQALSQNQGMWVSKGEDRPSHGLAELPG
ncbi:hypothetical protein VTK26DRAFT_5067 [Humicola hyalothermophila]